VQFRSQSDTHRDIKTKSKGMIVLFFIKEGLSRYIYFW